jgi:hypothetical protein
MLELTKTTVEDLETLFVFQTNKDGIWMAILPLMIRTMGIPGSMKQIHIVKKSGNKFRNKMVYFSPTF